MLISPKATRVMMDDLLQVSPFSFDLSEVARGRVREHGYVLIGDQALRGYKHKGAWRFDVREVRRIGEHLAALPCDLDDLVDARIPAQRTPRHMDDRELSDEGPDLWRPDWRRDVLSWLLSAADAVYFREGCPCAPTGSGRMCQRDGLQADALPCGLTEQQFAEIQEARTIAGTRPVVMMRRTPTAKAASKQARWSVPRSYAELLDRWEEREADVLDAARICSTCGAVGDDPGVWRLASSTGWITRCPECTDAQLPPYAGQLHGVRYTTSFSRAHRAEEYRCSLCTTPRQASCWDHCHEHGFVRGPLCRNCNALESNGWAFLAQPNTLGYLLTCPGCSGGSTLPQRHRERVAGWYAARTRHDDTCTKEPRVGRRWVTGDGMRFQLHCAAHREPVTWAVEVTGEEISNAVRSFITGTLQPLRYG